MHTMPHSFYAHFMTRQCNPTMLGFYVPLAHRILNHRSSVGGSQLLLVLWPRASHLGKELSTIQRPPTQVGHSWVSFGFFFFLENTFPHSRCPAVLPSLVLLPDQRFLSSCGFPSVLFTVPSLPFTPSFHIQVLLSWIALSWKLAIKIQGWLIGISFVLLHVIADFWICFWIGLPLIREVHRRAV